MLLLFSLQQADYSRQSKRMDSPVSTKLAGIQLCATSNCVTIMYTPQNDVTVQYMSMLSRLNAKRTGNVLAVESATAGTMY